MSIFSKNEIVSRPQPKRVYAIFDRVAEEFGPPVCAVNDGVAIRMYRQSIKDAGPQDDYRLYYIGDFDTSSGKLIAADVPELVEVINE